MKTIREWASELPKEFEVSILSQSSCLEQKHATLQQAISHFKKWDETVEGYVFWSVVDKHLAYGLELYRYSVYLIKTKTSDLEAVRQMQGWYLGEVESKADKSRRSLEDKEDVCCDEPDFTTDPEGLVSSMLGYVKALESGYIKEDDFIKLVRQRVG